MMSGNKILMSSLRSKYNILITRRVYDVKNRNFDIQNENGNDILTSRLVYDVKNRNLDFQKANGSDILTSRLVYDVKNGNL